jgi:hypothetical protein
MKDEDDQSRKAEEDDQRFKKFGAHQGFLKRLYYNLNQIIFWKFVVTILPSSRGEARTGKPLQWGERL